MNLWMSMTGNVTFVWVSYQCTWPVGRYQTCDFIKADMIYIAAIVKYIKCQVEEYLVNTYNRHWSTQWFYQWVWPTLSICPMPGSHRISKEPSTQIQCQPLVINHIYTMFRNLRTCKPMKSENLLAIGRFNEGRVSITNSIGKLLPEIGFEPIPIIAHHRYIGGTHFFQIFILFSI